MNVRYWETYQIGNL